jgi:hypothetical protein
MLDIITPYNSLLEEAKEIQGYCEITVSDNPAEIAERIVALSVYITRTGKMLADAKYHLRWKRKDEALALIRKSDLVRGMSAKVQSVFTDNLCKEAQYLVDWVERLNRAATHQLEAMRTLLSYEKESMRIAKTGY